MYAFKSMVELLLLIVIIFTEILPITETFKSIRPYKYYRRRPSHRPRWHPEPKPAKWHPPRKRPPPHYYPRYKPTYQSRYPAAFLQYENGIDYGSDEQPYTIEIEIPKRHGAAGYNHQRNIYNKRGYSRGEAYDEPDYDEYLEDDYADEQDRVIRTGKRKVRVKVNGMNEVIKGQKPKLNIRISRVDDIKPNTTESRPHLERQISTNLGKLETQFNEEWIPTNPRPSYPIHLRGA